MVDTIDNDFNYDLHRTLKGHKKAISSVRFSQNGDYLASASNDRTVRLWDAIDGTYTSTLIGHELGISDLSWSPDSSIIATASDDTNVNIWDVHNGRLIRKMTGHTNYVMCVDFHPLRNLVVSGSFDNSAKIWDIERGTCLFDLAAHEQMVVSANFSPDGTQLVTAGFDGYIKVWDVSTGAKLQSFIVGNLGTPVCFAKWSPNGKFILVGSFDGTWKLINSKTGKPAKTYRGHKFDDYCLFASFSLMRGKCIISGSADNTVCIWDINTKELKKQLKGHMDVVVAVDVHPSVDLIASGALDKDKTVRIWKLSEAYSCQLGEDDFS